MLRPGLGSRSLILLTLAAAMGGGASTAWAPPAGTSPAGPPFDADRAFSYLQAQSDFGPRVPGSSAHRGMLEYLTRFLRDRQAEVTEQGFTVAFGDSSVKATNVIARFHPTSTPRVMLCAHWDSRPWADSDPDTSRHAEPVPGANDGASGVAVLMEVANALASKEPVYGTDLVFFDAEDMGGHHGLDYTLGAKHYASRLRDGPAAAILVDMVGDSELDLPVEGYSGALAPSLAATVWSTAERLGLGQFRSETSGYVFDDHVPLLRAGVPAVVIIDMEYPYWHTLADTPDKCSPASLDAVGTLLLHLLYSPEALLGPVRR